MLELIMHTQILGHTCTFASLLLISIVRIPYIKIRSVSLGFTIGLFWVLSNGVSAKTTWSFIITYPHV